MDKSLRYIVFAVFLAVLGPQLPAEQSIKNQSQATAHAYQKQAQAVQENMRSVTQAQRKAAALSAASRRASSPIRTAAPVPGGTPDYFGGIYPNWANSPIPTIQPDGTPSGGIRKFVDSLPGLGPTAANNLGQYIAVANPDTITYPGSDYYEIGLQEYSEKMHSDLPPTKMRGYVQLNNGTDSTGTSNSVPPAPIHYLGPLIIAQKDRPVRIKFTNQLPTGAGGNLFLPVDTTVMGAGMGPVQMYAPDGTPMYNPDGSPMMESYTQNRATLHLHGGHTPWISDGTPHQWTTPANENTTYPKGVSVENVPDMPDPGPGSLTFFYTNQQSARLMFYHDHAYGITRLNVYAGEAAGYMITDTTEQALITSGTIPSAQIPLIIQDKTFVDADRIAAQDPTWNWGTTPPVPHTGDLWFPHVYMPNQWPNNPDNSGCNPMGRWDYGPWFWPPLTTALGLIHGPVASTPGGPLDTPGTPNPSLAPEAFMDTPVVNGTVYPYLQIEPKAYRLRILNACNDRYLNLQLYVADTGGGSGATAQATVTSGVVTGLQLLSGGSGYTSAPNVYFTGTGTSAEAVATVAGGVVTSLTLTCGGSGFTTAPLVTIGSDKEVKMVPAIPHDCDPTWPATWPTDGRDGGVPDPIVAGPPLIQIGTEAGFLPAPVVIPSTPVGYNYNRRDIVVLNVENKSLFLGPAERADVIVDFSGYTSGTKLILYNDAPAPVPAFDTRTDYYTGDPDQRDTGGASPTLPGYGPNTRTVLQFQVSGTSTTAFNLAELQAVLPAAYAASQPPPIVPETAYGATTDTYARIQDSSISFTPLGTTQTVTVPLQPKAIQELFELNYGRMNATLGVELPMTNMMNQTTIPYGYIDPPTETMQDGSYQIWKITHNGVDTHAIHFHLFDVQVINRVGWDGAVRPPDPNELGWKDTVRMNPLEDCIVAMKPTKPSVPFNLPDSIRPYDVTAPLGSTAGFFDVDPITGNPITVINELFNFGSEYVWHCHLLGHEENDMMRPVVFQIAPGAPTNVTATAGNAQAIVAFNAPPTGGSPILNYTVTALPAAIMGIKAGGKTLSVSGASSPITVTGLQNGNPYWFTVTATNAIGTGPASGKSNVVIPATVPDPPTAVSAVAGNAQATVSFTPPLSNGGVPITMYTVTSSPGNVTATGTVSPINVTGLTNGTAYTFTVAATNKAGTSVPSAPSNSVTPAGPPDAPTGVTALAGNASAVVSFTPPVFNGGAPILSYTVTSSPGNKTASGTATSLTVTGLTNGSTYTFTVTAKNSVGTGPASVASNAVRPTGGVPGTPNNLRATASALSTSPPTVTLTWTSNAGPGTAFRIQRALNRGMTQQPVTFTVAPGVTTYIDTTVAINTRYYYQVQAFNVNGASAYTQTVNVTTPGQLPAAPAAVGAAAAGTGVVITWTAGGAAGAAAVQFADTVSIAESAKAKNKKGGFYVERSTAGGNGPWKRIGKTKAAVSSYTDKRVKKNVTYWYRVQAFNGAGKSQYSSVVSVTTLP